MKKYLFSAFIVLLLASCVHSPEKMAPPSKSEPTPVSPPSPESVSPEPSATGTVPSPPSIQSFDWTAPMTLLIENMDHTKDLADGSVLLVDTVKNNTNGALPIQKATETLQHILSSNKRFFLIPASQLASAKAALGISEDDKLGSRSKSIGLARYLNAEYVLYTDVSGDVESPVIDMQLMLVKTGEIIWSDSKLTSSST